MIYQYKLYIFDLDGTIIDSEYSHYEAYNNQLLNKIYKTYYIMSFVYHFYESKIVFVLLFMS